MKLPSAARLLPVLLAFTAILPACSSAPEEGFTKVKIFRLNPDRPINAVDPSIRFEQQHHLFGAVSHDEREARRGTYFTFFWRTRDISKPVKVRLDYLQAATGFEVKSKEVEVTDVKRSNITKFEVTGEEYRVAGPVLAWRAVLTQDGKELAEKRSAMWK